MPASKSKQKGLAALEMLLIAPVFLSIGFLILKLADTAAIWEERIIESRNAAYRTEIYNQGAVDQLDNLLAGNEKSLRVASVLSGDLSNFLNQGNRVKRYSKSGSKDQFEKLINESRSVNENPHMGAQNIRNLTNILDNTEVDATIGIGFSRFKSPVGQLENLFLKYREQPTIRLDYVLRESHTADFADTVDVSNRPSLCLGYDNAMQQYLNPGQLYSGIFPLNAKNCEIAPLISVPSLTK